jgi:hypothetical protein
VLVPLALTVCAAAATWTALRIAGNYLIVDQASPADCASCTHVWIGDVQAHGYDLAAKLYHARPNRTILVSVAPPDRLIQLGAAPSLAENSERALRRRGVPADAIVFLRGSDFVPRVEAEHFRVWLAEQQEARVLLPYSRFEGRRFAWALNDALTPQQRACVKFVALPEEEFDEDNWWYRRTGLKRVADAYVVLMFDALARASNREHRWMTPEAYEQWFLASAEAAG